ncbi:MAG: tRNA-dihydrouridine synthase family protein [Deltaproteobacteria bacterium]|nr:tRNA-dihydrouridine synthase family protein [Deltaproteobacteria bacterium]
MHGDLQEASLAFLPRGAVVLAPLSGFGDLPFRRIARASGMQYAFAPMVDASALAIGSKRTQRIAERGEEEDWFGVQIVGADPERIARSAEWLTSLRPDVMDLNMGCPAPKVRRKGQGCAMLEHPELVGRCVRAMTQATDVPVTVKARLTPEGAAAPIIEVVQAAADSGASAATVHARTPRQRYGGPVQLDVLAEIVRASPIPVIGNGGVYSRWHYEQMMCDVRPYAVMVAGGVIGNPWLFRSLTGESPWPDGLPEKPVADAPPTLEELVGAIRSQVAETVAFYGQESGYPRTRKLIIRYLKGRGFPSTARVAASHVSSQADLDELAKILLACRPPLPRF